MCFAHYTLNLTGGHECSIAQMRPWVSQVSVRPNGKKLYEKTGRDEERRYGYIVGKASGARRVVD
jgi:hypothetical protein